MLWVVLNLNRKRVVEQMASYTMELRDCLSTLLIWDGVDVTQFTRNQLIEEGRKKLFNFEYEIFDQNYKAVWETNFIRNFFFREIGFETEELFQFQLETWMRINMPYFNKLFESQLIKFDPLINSSLGINSTTQKDKDSTVDSTTNGDSTKTNKQTVDGTNHQTVDETNEQDTTGTTHQTNDGTNHQTMDGSENGTSFNRHLESDTPDNRLAITTADGSGVIEYASLIGEDTGKSDKTTSSTIDGNTSNEINGNTTSNVTGSNTSNTDGTTSSVTDGTNTDKTTLIGNTKSSINDTETYVQSRTGKIGDVTYSKMLMEYRESLIRIELRMFNEMQKLFMLVY